ncbi:histidine ammonia-lyase, partial [bacterium]|nr:histidine ammonia-lyase [bacterium]
QALDLRMEKTLGQLGRGTAIAHRVIRDKIPTLEHDRQMSDDIAYALRLIRSGELLKAVEEKIELT